MLAVSSQALQEVSHFLQEEPTRKWLAEHAWQLSDPAAVQREQAELQGVQRPVDARYLPSRQGVSVHTPGKVVAKSDPAHAVHPVAVPEQVKQVESQSTQSPERIRVWFARQGVEEQVPGNAIAWKDEAQVSQCEALSEHVAQVESQAWQVVPFKNFPSAQSVQSWLVVPLHDPQEESQARQVVPFKNFAEAQVRQFWAEGPSQVAQDALHGLHRPFSER